MKFSGVKKILIGALVVILLGSMVTPALQANEVCEQAFKRCMVDALIVLIFSGFQTFLFYSTACALGYDWCNRYYLQS